MPQKGREGNGWPILGTAKIASMLDQWKDKQTWNKRRQEAFKSFFNYFLDGFGELTSKRTDVMSMVQK